MAEIHFVTEDDDLEGLSLLTHDAFFLTDLGQALTGSCTDKTSSTKKSLLDAIAHRRSLSTDDLPPDTYLSARKDGLTGKIAICATLDGKAVGLAIWELPPIAKSQGTNPSPDPSLLTEDMVPQGTNYELLNELLKTSTADTRAKMTTPHYHLRSLTVDPSIHRQGIGSKLLKWGLDRADLDGLPTFLHSSPLGYSLYLRYGFEPFETVYVDGKYALVPMIRHPQR